VCLKCVQGDRAEPDQQERKLTTAGPDRERILKRLREDVKGAEQRRDTASERFHEIMSQVPSGIPHPDNTLRIQQASREFSTTRQEVLSAISKLNDYLAHGKVPPDLN
jgi:hypothetical protein